MHFWSGNGDNVDDTFLIWKLPIVLKSTYSKSAKKYEINILKNMKKDQVDFKSESVIFSRFVALSENLNFTLNSL